MLFYFSGTGNSFYAAKKIADSQGEKLIPISKEFEKKTSSFQYEVKDNELIGFIFPVYAWAPPKMVLDFISRLNFTGGKPYIFSLCTCGAEEGLTTNILQKALADKGLSLNSSFAIKMPENYVVGADVESEEKANEKLKQAEEKLEEINIIIGRRQSGVFINIVGKLPKLKSYMVNSLFNRFAIGTKKFYATEKCTGCKICEKVCPVNTIKVEKKPTWGHSCTQCLACINICPSRAIQYGKGTVKKGRYFNPNVNINEMFLR